MSDRSNSAAALSARRVQPSNLPRVLLGSRHTDAQMCDRPLGLQINKLVNCVLADRQAAAGSMDPQPIAQETPANGSLYAGGALASGQTAEDAEKLEVMTRELRTVAALEVSLQGS